MPNLILGLFMLLATGGCAMFTSWRTIPPPGGCDQCHTLPIGNNWKVAYQAVYLTDERDREYFQTEEFTRPTGDKADSPLELRKVAELKCFACHRSPNAAHLGRKGRFHH